MGALTDNRKRCFVDLCLPFSSSSSPSPSHPHSELTSDTPLFKKLKTSSPPSIPAQLQQQGQVHSKSRSFPALAPLRRPVHGPQRILKVFGLGSSKSCRRSSPEQVGGKELDTAMGNFVSVSRSIKRKTVDSLWSRWKGEASVEHVRDRESEDESPRGLKLEEYKRLIGRVQEGHSVVTDQRSAETPSTKVRYPRAGSPGASDLTILTRKDEEMPELHVLNRKVEAARRMVKVESTPASVEAVRTNKTPLYKELLEASSRKYDSKLSSLDFEVKLAEKKISGFRIASLEKEPKEAPLEPPFAPLTDEEENDVELALQDPDRFRLCRHEVLVIHESSNIEITREVMQCLRQSAWLNDEVINLYFELLKERERRDPKKYLKCHFFNTFFYKKLISGRDGYDFKAVRRWTTQRKIGYGLVECDKIFVPIHKEIHWCLAVINVKDEKLQYLDSLGGMDNEALRVLARYIIDEAKDKSNKVIDIKSWKHEPVDDLPLQRNGWDCGMFMLKYADFYSRGLRLCFGQEHMAYFRKRTAKEILSLRAD